MGIRAETLAIGDELLVGRISDTNSTFVSWQMGQKGIRVLRHVVVRDDPQQIIEGLESAIQRCDLLLVFGGLGPTSDDITVDVVAKFLNSAVAVHDASKDKLLALYRMNQREVTQSALRQVRYPVKSEPYFNEVGLAPAFSFEMGSCRVFCLPGVPREMKAFFQRDIQGWIDSRMSASKERTQTKTFRLMGIWESQLQTVVEKFEKSLPANAQLGFRTIYPENHLTLYWQSNGQDTSEFEKLGASLGELVRPWCYSDSERTLEDMIVDRLKSNGQRIAIAESCTAGLGVHRLTRVASASEVVWGGTVVYQLAAKDILLGVKVADSESAVSAACSLRLAEAIKLKSGCDWGAAITGWMGPSGGDTEESIGTIYIAVVGPITRQLKLKLPIRDREELQWGASSYLLFEILQALPT